MQDINKNSDRAVSLNRLVTKSIKLKQEEVDNLWPLLIFNFEPNDVHYGYDEFKERFNEKSKNFTRTNIKINRKRYKFRKMIKYFF